MGLERAGSVQATWFVEMYLFRSGEFHWITTRRIVRSSIWRPDSPQGSAPISRCLHLDPNPDRPALPLGFGAGDSFRRDESDGYLEVASPCPSFSGWSDWMENPAGRMTIRAEGNGAQGYWSAVSALVPSYLCAKCNSGAAYGGLPHQVHNCASLRWSVLKPKSVQATFVFETGEWSLHRSIVSCRFCRAAHFRPSNRDAQLRSHDNKQRPNIVDERNDAPPAPHIGRR